MKKKKIFACLGMLGLALSSLFASPIVSHAEYSSHISHTSTSYKDITTDLALGVLDGGNATIGVFDSKFVIPRYEVFAFYKTEFDSFSWDSSLKSFWREWEGEVTFDSSSHVINTVGEYNCCSEGKFKDHCTRFSPDMCYFGYFVTDFKFKGRIHGIDLHVSFEPDLTKPTVTGTNLFSVDVDSLPSQEEILSHVSVTDDVDPTPTIQVVSSTYDSTQRKLGDYKIVVKGVDASGNTSANYTITVRVVDNTAPTITGTNIDSQPNNVKLTDEQIKAQFRATDNYYATSDLTLTLIRNDYSAKWNKPGVYLIECKATDGSGNVSSFTTISIRVVDKTNPTVTGTNITSQPNNVKLTDEQILAKFTASDDIAVKSKNLINNGYSSQWNRPGSYTVECEVFDSSNNRATATITINVVDKTAPTVTGSTIDRIYNQKLEDLKSLFTFSDDVTTAEDLTFSITEDNYTSAFDKKGSYTIKATFTDAAGNLTQATSTINVIDNIKPVITAPTEITVGNGVKLTDEELRSKIKVVDGYDGALSSYTISDPQNYVDSYTIPGNYTRVITASDASGNTQTLTITIIVNDTTAPEVWFDSYFVVLQAGETLSEAELTSYAVQTLEIAPEDIVSIEGEYDTAKAGEYPLSVKLSSGDVKSLTLLVTEEAASGDDKPGNNFFSFANYADNVFKFQNYKNWTFWIWSTWIVVGIVGVASIVYVVRKKK